MATREEWEKLMPGVDIPDSVVKYVMTPKESKIAFEKMPKEEKLRIQKWAED